MKTVIEIFDIVLLIIILGIMLPVMFVYINPLTDTESWGFSVYDDKTMKLAEGDVLTSGTGDKMTAAEVLLMTRYSIQENINTNRFILPNGYTVTIDENYQFIMDTNTQQAKNSLNTSYKYAVEYDYTADVWRIK